MAAFQSTAFSTDAFSILAFDFGGDTPTSPPTAAPTQPTGGWLLRERKWTVRLGEKEKSFDDPVKAALYLEELEESEEKSRVKKAKRIGKAPVIEYAGKQINDIRVEGRTGPQIMRGDDSRLLSILVGIIESKLRQEAVEEEEILLMLAATA